jgi:hypothetical protein
MSVTEAITQTVGLDMMTILVFGDANMIFYEGEGLKNRHISRLVL